jgi:hypothetical protein
LPQPTLKQSKKVPNFTQAGEQTSDLFGFPFIFSCTSAEVCSLARANFKREQNSFKVYPSRGANLGSFWFPVYFLLYLCLGLLPRLTIYKTTKVFF